MRTFRILAVSLVLAFGATFISCDDGGDSNDPGDAKTEQTTIPEGDVVDQGGETRTVPKIDAIDNPDDEIKVPECTNQCTPAFAQECVGDASFRVCSPDEQNCLAWQEAQLCPPEQKCNAETGVCQAAEVCLDECEKTGLKGCGPDGIWITDCQLGDDGCRHWEQLESCTPAQCVDGACGSGGEECTGILTCSSGCQTEACVQNCMSPASQPAQDQYMDLMVCASDECSQFQAEPMKLQACMYAQCGEYWADCVGGWGEQGCIEVLNCAGDCGMDGACQGACFVEGTQQGLIDLFDLQACLQEKCVPDCGNDQNCLQNCLMDECTDEAMACEGL